MNTENKTAVFQLNHTVFAYPFEKPVLKDINLEIFAGERICILGANGCGKSTLFKILTGLLTPQEGSFSAFGSEVTQKKLHNDAFAKAYHKRVGFIFQDSDVQLFCSTVEEEIAFGLLQQDLPQDTVRQRIHEISQMLGIESLLKKTPFKLSGGEKKKVALASVLVMNPDVLILDEPANGLDPRTQSWLIRLLTALNGVGKTIITSTHNLELVEKISNRSILFNEDHTIAADKPTPELIHDKKLLVNANLIDEEV